MIRFLAVILLLVHMVLGLFIWLEDHDDNQRRVIRLGLVLGVAVALLFVIYFSSQ
jgi:succinate dehydrogenase hydrophobic anchor subunit